MGKQNRKKQKTGKAASDVRPLGSRVSLTGKDDEERQLESLLFGTKFLPSGSKSANVLVLSDGEEEFMDEAGKELENMMDKDLFFIDDSAPSLPKDVPELVFVVDKDAQDFEAVASPELPDRAEDENDSSREPQIIPVNPPDPLPTKSRKAPAWTDPDDTTLQISLASNKRLRKLRDAPSEDTVGGREYERRLRRQYERINPTPDWASNARNKKPKRRRSSSRSSEGDEDNQVTELLSSTSGILGTKATARTLMQGTLAIERLRDANQSAKSEGEVKVVRFHPSPQVPVLLTASVDRRLRLFNIDGLTNPHLQTLHIPSLPLTNALFHPSGSSVLMTGPRPFYYTYDLQSGSTQRSPRGLWGTTFKNANPSAQDSSMEKCAFNPTGDVLAVAGRRGYVHLVDWKAGSGQVVGSVKMNSGVMDLWWCTREGGGQDLMTLGEDSGVYVWDVGTRRCVRRWSDDGGFGSRVMGGDRGGKYLAIGSNIGFVNVYGGDGLNPSSTAGRPKPLKTIGNLTTSISTLRFNHDAQLLAIASKEKKDQMRIIHLPSLTAFANWPTSSTPLGHVTSIDFSAGSEYVAVGNNRGRVLLYSLKDFGSR